jgi:hypothetical protein
MARLAWLATVLAVFILAISGFGAPFLRGGQSLGGLLLLSHMTAGGLFIAGLLGMALFSAETHRFGGVWSGGAIRKFFFWCVLALGVATILATLISMTPLVEPQGIKTLSETHRVLALFLVMSLIGHGLSR